MKKKVEKPTTHSNENESTSTQTDSKIKGNITEFPGQPPQKKEGQQKEVQLPQGDLITDISQTLSCKKQAFKELPIKEIKHFEIIKDFKVPTRSAYPLVIFFKDSGHYHCVDGWNLVQEAKKNNENTIKCHVFYMDSFNAAATGIFKLAMRSMPVGGICTHAEMIFNIRICFRLIMGGHEIPKACKHGGARKGSGFDNNFSQRIVELLVEHLGKSKRKIREYINHGADIPDETLEFLVEKKAGRRFFTAVQKNKSNVVAKLKQKGLSQEAIQKEISARMKEWYKEYEKTEEITDEFKKAALPPEEVRQIPDKIIAPVKKGPQPHKNWTGNTSTQENLPPTMEQIYDELGILIEPFVQLQKEKPDITEDFIRQVLSTAKQLILLTESMEHLLAMVQPSTKLEVA